MTVTFPRDFPTISAPNKLTWTSNSVVGRTQAPFSGIQQVQEFQGSWWQGVLSFAPMTQDVGRTMAAFFQSLRGRAGSFLLAPPRYEGPYGAAAVNSGALQVDGADQSGFVLAVKTTGLGGAVPDFLVAGDLLSYGSGATRRLYVVTTDASLDGAGKATLDIWPRLRESPADNLSLDVDTPTGRFRLVDNQLNYDEDEAGNITLGALSIEEDLTS